jgi:hypothetical protein
MREELGPNICAYSEGELAEALKNRPPIMYYMKRGTEQGRAILGCLRELGEGKVEVGS